MYTKGMQIIQSLPNKTNFFSLIFERSKFRKFRGLEKVAKIIAGEKKKRWNSNRLSENKTWIRDVPSHGLIGKCNC